MEGFDLFRSNAYISINFESILNTSCLLYTGDIVEGND